MTYRNVATVIWTDDNILNMSPEQKLIFLYLHTSPYTSACGIFKLHPKTMGFQIGLTTSPLESSLRGLCAAFPDFVAVDWDTMEVGLLQYPRQLLITANNRALAIVAKDIQQIESQYLLRELVKRNSAGLSAPYVAQLRRLQMQAINNRNANILLDGDVSLAFDNQQTNCEKETKQNKQTKESTHAQLEDSYEPVNTWLTTTENEGQFLVTTIALETTPTESIDSAGAAFDWMQVARDMEAYAKGDGAAQWRFMCEAQGYTGEILPIVSNWASKASKYQLMRWKDEFRKLQTWLKTESRADYKAAQRNGTQPTPPAAPVQIRREI